MNELSRILKSGGILLLTTMGNNFRHTLTKSEISSFDKGLLVTRGNVREGHRTFAAFQPKEFMLQLLSRFQILEHSERKPEKNKAIPQDIWIVRK